MELVRRDESDTVVICVHPGGMPTRSYMQLATQMTDYSWHLVELSLNRRYASAVGKSDLPSTILSEIADEVIEELGELWESKRICLLGWSFGGVLASEMARRRHDASCGVILLDSIAPRLFDDVMDGTQPDRLVRLSRTQVVTVRWFTDYMRVLKQVDWEIEGSDAHNLSEEALIELMCSRLIEKGGLPASTSTVGFSKVYREFAKGMNRNIAIILAHQPETVDYPLHLIRSEYPLYEIFHIHEDMGWGKLATDLSVSSVPFGHYDMLLSQPSLDHISVQIEKMSRRLT
ncbi:thioesterase domain-containing protein [Rhizobium paknamense]|uniref:Thioesterase domain-containing protein n=1 Tax=Rhizobium paknamense TaxID=1206817 RepID=A0ABU0IDT7_9HYPH|nr:alpha/beta fold hydrolase [Rhizobium paknamense]MDQ0456408.1 thioesterase domain-containing protein [Rhizobium paknamense]